MIYDLLNPSSLDSIETWLEEIRENTNNDSFLALIGNKKDLQGFDGLNLKAQKFAEKHQLYYYETSALWDRSCAEGIETIMMDFVYEIIKNMPNIAIERDDEEEQETVEEDFDEKGGVEGFKSFKAKVKGKEEAWKKTVQKNREVSVSLSLEKKGCCKKKDECMC